MKKILCVVTSNNVKGSTGIPTGFWLSELTHPMKKFEDAGFEISLASIKGGKPPIDEVSLDFSDAINKKFWDDAMMTLTRKIMTQYFLQAVTALCGIFLKVLPLIKLHVKFMKTAELFRQFVTDLVHL